MPKVYGLMQARASIDWTIPTFMNSVRAILEFLFITCLVILIICRGHSTSPSLVYERFYLFLPRDRNDYRFTNTHRRFDGETILKEQKHKKVISVSLVGDSEDVDKRMSFIRFKARELKFTNDTTYYIKIALPEALTYRQFIDILRMMNEDKHKRYMLFRDNFYIFSEALAPPDGEEAEVETISL